ncbi:hypothetical protein DFJ73DRAFT_762239 [Zopfochytrium polystomum]|nr:hypothetical protein DFJ73DRAFT_762239 [Zopfochytrium polystomum]
MGSPSLAIDDWRRARVVGKRTFGQRCRKKRKMRSGERGQTSCSLGAAVVLQTERFKRMSAGGKRGSEIPAVPRTTTVAEVTVASDSQQLRVARDVLLGYPHGDAATASGVYRVSVLTPPPPPSLRVFASQAAVGGKSKIGSRPLPAFLTLPLVVNRPDFKTAARWGGLKLAFRSLVGGASRNLRAPCDQTNVYGVENKISDATYHHYLLNIYRRSCSSREGANEALSYFLSPILCTSTGENLVGPSRLRVIYTRKSKATANRYTSQAVVHHIAIPALTARAKFAAEPAVLATDPSLLLFRLPCDLTSSERGLQREASIRPDQLPKRELSEDDLETMARKDLQQVAKRFEGVKGNWQVKGGGELGWWWRRGEVIVMVRRKRWPRRRHPRSRPATQSETLLPQQPIVARPKKPSSALRLPPEWEIAAAAGPIINRKQEEVAVSGGGIPVARPLYLEETEGMHCGQQRLGFQFGDGGGGPRGKSGSYTILIVPFAFSVPLVGSEDTPVLETKFQHCQTKTAFGVCARRQWTPKKNA